MCQMQHHCGAAPGVELGSDRERTLDSGHYVGTMSSCVTGSCTSSLREGSLGDALVLWLSTQTLHSAEGYVSVTSMYSFLGVKSPEEIAIGSLGEGPGECSQYILAMVFHVASS